MLLLEPPPPSVLSQVCRTKGRELAGRFIGVLESGSVAMDCQQHVVVSCVTAATCDVTL